MLIHMTGITGSPLPPTPQAVSDKPFPRGLVALRLIGLLIVLTPVWLFGGILIGLLANGTDTIITDSISVEPIITIWVVSGPISAAVAVLLTGWAMFKKNMRTFWIAASIPLVTVITYPAMVFVADLLAHSRS